MGWDGGILKLMFNIQRFSGVVTYLTVLHVHALCTRSTAEYIVLYVCTSYRQIRPLFIVGGRFRVVDFFNHLVFYHLEVDS